MDAVHIKPITLQDLLRLSAKEGRFEVIDGEIVEMSPVGFRHVIVAGNAYRVLYDFATPQKLGYVCTDNLIYILHVDPETGIRKTRIPDASFIRKGRLPKDFDLGLPFPGAPDLAVEVMSPDDSAPELLAKIRHYFAYGTEQVWVLYPDQRELHQHIRGVNQIRIYGENDTLRAESLFPGLEIKIKDLFALPDVED
jgi:Uma2 family endonuclease